MTELVDLVEISAQVDETHFGVEIKGALTSS